MPLMGFEPTITAIKRLQTNTLNRTATGISECYITATTNQTRSKLPEIHNTDRLQELQLSKKSSCLVKNLDETIVNQNLVHRLFLVGLHAFHYATP